MARYILIDNCSGYIFGDSADIGGRLVVGTPTEAAMALDASIQETPHAYEEVGRLADNEAGYHVYRADVGGGEAVPVVEDGQDPATIAAVKRNCEYITTLRRVATGD